jgi:Holliday junction DNA helicase RuvB
MLYQALDERALSIPVFEGVRPRLVKIRLEPFLLIGATTEECLLPAPLRSRFAIRERLDFYAIEDLAKMAIEEGKAKGFEVTPDGAAVLARGARGTPRILLGHLTRARDLASLEEAAVDAGVARRALERAGIDRRGLTETDRKILEILHDRGGPVSLRTLSDLLGESPETVAEVYEPHLLREGYIARTWRGRIATEKAGLVVFESALDRIDLDIDFGDLGSEPEQELLRL